MAAATKDDEIIAYLRQHDVAMSSAYRLFRKFVVRKLERLITAWLRTIDRQVDDPLLVIAGSSHVECETGDSDLDVVAVVSPTRDRHGHASTEQSLVQSFGNYMRANEEFDVLDIIPAARVKLVKLSYYDDKLYPEMAGNADIDVTFCILAAVQTLDDIVILDFNQIMHLTQSSGSAVKAMKNGFRLRQSAEQYKAYRWAVIALKHFLNQNNLYRASLGYFAGIYCEIVVYNVLSTFFEPNQVSTCQLLRRTMLLLNNWSPPEPFSFVATAGGPGDYRLPPINPQKSRMPVLAIEPPHENLSENISTSGARLLAAAFTRGLGLIDTFLSGPGPVNSLFSEEQFFAKAQSYIHVEVILEVAFPKEGKLYSTILYQVKAFIERHNSHSHVLYKPFIENRNGQGPVTHFFVALLDNNINQQLLNAATNDVTDAVVAATEFTPADVDVRMNIVSAAAASATHAQLITPAIAPHRSLKVLLPIEVMRALKAGRNHHYGWQRRVTEAQGLQQNNRGSKLKYLPLDDDFGCLLLTSPLTGDEAPAAAAIFGIANSRTQALDPTISLMVEEEKVAHITQQLPAIRNVYPNVEFELTGTRLYGWVLDIDVRKGGAVNQAAASAIAQLVI